MSFLWKFSIQFFLHCFLSLSRSWSFSRLPKTGVFCSCAWNRRPIRMNWLRKKRKSFAKKFKNSLFQSFASSKISFDSRAPKKVTPNCWQKKTKNARSTKKVAPIHTPFIIFKCSKFERRSWDISQSLLIANGCLWRKLKFQTSVDAMWLLLLLFSGSAPIISNVISFPLRNWNQ